ncbi:MAG: FG-GAP repeat protein [Acidobacteria bacterium]|nr:FG-GAP repeat protein [Acidobacteriota bacterium]
MVSVVALFLSLHFVASLKADDINTQALQTIDLATTTPGVTVIGASADDKLGGNGSANTFSSTPRSHPLARGDFNRDGIQDLAIGAPEADFTPTGGPLRANTGAVYIIFGRQSFTTGSVIDASLSAATQPDIKIFGAAADDNLGFSLAVGDINGDGSDDLLIGAPGVDASSPTRADTGAVYILLGASTLTAKTIDLAQANAINIAIIGEKAGDKFGTAVASGEVGGSGAVADILVGAVGSKGPAGDRTDAGAAYLLYGGSGLTPNPVTTTRVLDLGATTNPVLPNVKIFGTDGSLLGSSLAIGELDGSSPNDIVVGAPKANRPAPGPVISDTGAAYIVFGGTNLLPISGATRSFDLAAGEQNVAIYGANSADHLGAAVAVGDVTGDGRADLILGAPDADGPSEARVDSGEAYLISGSTTLPTRINVSTTSVNLTIYGEAANDHLGSTVAVGRLNTSGNVDNIAELLVGSPGAQLNKGTVSAFFGGASLTLISARDLALGQDDLRVIGQAAGDNLGWAIAVADLDNNQGGDLILSAPFADAGSPTRTDAGKVYVLFAANDNVPPTNLPPQVQVTAPNGGDNLIGGSTFNITWTASDPNGDATLQSFEIRLSIDGGATFNTIIASSLAGSARSFTWTVNGGLDTLTARIRVIARDSAGATGQDDSNANFSITDPGISVHLLAPNGGEVLKFGQVFRVTWEVPTAAESQVKGFDLFLSTDGGATFPISVKSDPINPGLGSAIRSFDWTVPNTCTTTARILVVATSTTSARSSDSSDANFTINSPGPTIDTATMAIDGRLVLRSIQPPIGNEVRFTETSVLEISSTDAGTQFFTFSKPPKLKKEGRVLISKGTINNLELDTFFPDTATRFIRVTLPPCGVTLLKVRRQGTTLVVVP